MIFLTIFTFSIQVYISYVASNPRNTMKISFDEISNTIAENSVLHKIHVDKTIKL